MEKILSQYGDTWVWCSFDPRTKVLPVFIVGKRTRSNAEKLISKLDKVTDGTIPFFTSDELKCYEEALLKTYGIREEIPREPGKRGRPRKLKLSAPPELKYAQVVKKRRKGRVVSIDTTIVFGNKDEIEKLLESSPVNKSVNISFVERNNLTLRQNSRRLTRKTNGFSKEIGRLEDQLYLASGYYHFVKEHSGLRQRSCNDNRKWNQRTPAMAAQLTDHIWPTRELIIYRVP